jgi:hypothetical protein
MLSTSAHDSIIDAPNEIHMKRIVLIVKRSRKIGKIGVEKDGLKEKSIVSLYFHYDLI